MYIWMRPTFDAVSLSAFCLARRSSILSGVREDELAEAAALAREEEEVEDEPIAMMHRLGWI